MMSGVCPCLFCSESSARCVTSKRTRPSSWFVTATCSDVLPFGSLRVVGLAPLRTSSSASSSSRRNTAISSAVRPTESARFRSAPAFTSALVTSLDISAASTMSGVTSTPRIHSALRSAPASSSRLVSGRSP